MTDIVLRLLQWAIRSTEDNAIDMMDAAYEIERLRNNIANLEEHIKDLKAGLQ